MKSTVFILFSLLLTTAILAPSFAVLCQNDDNTEITIDFNEEEEKEVGEKDFFLDSDSKSLALLQRENNNISNYYVEVKYRTSITIFLLPPEPVV